MTFGMPVYTAIPAALRGTPLPFPSVNRINQPFFRTRIRALIALGGGIGLFLAPEALLPQMARRADANRQGDTLDITHFVVILAWFLGAFLGGIGGIGLLLVALPLLSLVMPVHTAVLVCCLATPFTDMTMVIRYWKYCRWKAILPMCVGIIPGSLLGLWILKIVSGPVLEGALGVFLLCFLVWQRFGHVGRGSENWKGAFTAGSLAGLLGTSIAVDGPPVGAYGLYAGWQPMAYLGTLNCFFVARSIVTVILQGTAGMYTPEVIHFTIWSVPAAIAGMLLSFPVVKHIRVDLFRTIVRVLIAAGGIVCIYHAFEKGLWERILALFAA